MGRRRPRRSEKWPSQGEIAASKAAEMSQVAEMASEPQPRSASRSGASTPSIPNPSAGTITNQIHGWIVRSKSARPSSDTGCSSSGFAAWVSAAQTQRPSASTATDANVLPVPA